jgi:hypothetical protein
MPTEQRMLNPGMGERAQNLTAAPPPAGASYLILILFKMLMLAVICFGWYGERKTPAA